MRIPECSKSYDKRTVLRVPEISVEPGKIYAVIGPNGSGKSTFARVIAGVLAPDGRKSLSLEGRVRYMPQKSYPFRMNVEKNILLSGGDPARAEELMDALGLRALARQRAASLSGGENAKMALARLLMKPCELLILDEPTSAMDMESAIAAEKLIDNYRRDTGCAVLFVTHDLSQARRMADEAWFFFRGELCEHGPAQKLLFAPEKEETRRFLDFYGGAAARR
ncbi:MAG: ABC transporter ATP-binding protein [Oscillospiraceae bacterium]|nr:ABC transporter ATP-binding protein [Oscillospiraceae bacterium]